MKNLITILHRQMRYLFNKLCYEPVKCFPGDLKRILDKLRVARNKYDLYYDN